MKKMLIVSIMGCLVRSTATAQGCSDAGVCTAGPIGEMHLWQDSLPDVVDYRHYALLGYSYALGEQGTTIMQASAEISFGIGPRLSVQARVPYQWASGNLGDAAGFGDIITTVSYAFVKERDRNLTGVSGLRMPTGRTNELVSYPNSSEPFARALPMPYQTGLGTTDLLLAVQYRSKRWTSAIAYQHVLQQGNMNTFTHEAWDNSPEAIGYFESYHLERANDVVARLQYTYGCGRLTLQPGLLAIQHLQEDLRFEGSITHMERVGNMVPVEGSQGLTLNITADLRYKLADHWAIEAMFGTPVVTREVRPDGLTRSLVTGFALRYRF